MKQGWEIKKLKEVCSFVGGYTPSPSLLCTEGCIPYFKVSDMNRYGNSRELYNTELYLKEAKKTYPAGAIVFPKNGGAVLTNKKRILVTNSVVDLNTGVAIPNSVVNVDYLYFFFCGVDFCNFVKEGTLPVLKIKEIGELPIFLPPLEEQERIVEILDREFERIDALKANAEQNLQHAKDLFQAALKQELQPKEGWETKTIGEICTLKSGNSNANNTPEGTLPFVKVGDMNIQGNEERITCSSNYVSYTANIKGIFPIGTVIFPKRGGAILTNKKRITSVEICCDLNIMGVYSNGAIIPELLYFYFLGVDLSKIYNGAAIPQINNGDIAPLTISFPKKLTEQYSVVNRLIKHREICKALEENYKKTIVLCDDMKQALLRKAFNGEL